MPTATELAEAVRSGRTTPQRAAQDAFQRIVQLDTQLQAWVELDANAIVHAQSTGPLAGVPVGVKDIFDVAGLPTRYGAAPFAHKQPIQDSVAVARLRAAGATILGKTHTTQFALLDPAPTHNPWNLAHTPGGSSSGSAAAVAAGMIPLALGSQTVGSVLRPAAYCGIVGLKPTFGRIPCTGVGYLAPSFDHVGVLCTSVADAALALSLLAGPDEGDPRSLNNPLDDYVGATANPSPPRIGIVRSYYRAEAADNINRHLEDVAERCAKAGATVVEAEMPADAATFRTVANPFMSWEVARVHRERYSLHARDYAPGIAGTIETGLKTSDADAHAAQAVVHQMRAATIALLGTVDVLLLPTAPQTAPTIETTGNGIFCAPASFTGLPAISLPSGVEKDGLPLAVQLMAGPLEEARLLAAAAWLERLLNFTAKPPLAS